MHELLSDTMRAAIREMKEPPATGASGIPIYQYGRVFGWLTALTHEDAGNADTIGCLTTWRAALGGEAPSFAGTDEDTRRWLVKEVLPADERLLFWVQGKDGGRVGLIGLGSFDWADRRAVITDLFRGVPDVYPGLMYAATQTLIAWTFQTFGMQEVEVRLGADNPRAARLVERCGFRCAAADDHRNVKALQIARCDWMAGHRLDRAA